LSPPEKHLIWLQGEGVAMLQQLPARHPTLGKMHILKKVGAQAAAIDPSQMLPEAQSVGMCQMQSLRRPEDATRPLW
jgi:hypothetical protein